MRWLGPLRADCVACAWRMLRSLDCLSSRLFYLGAGVDLSPTSRVVSEDDSSSNVDAECTCGCQLIQPVGQIILAANHSCFQPTRPVVWHILADPGRVVQFTYRLLAREHRHHDTFDPSRSAIGFSKTIFESVSFNKIWIIGFTVRSQAER